MGKSWALPVWCASQKENKGYSVDLYTEYRASATFNTRALVIKMQHIHHTVDCAQYKHGFALFLHEERTDFYAYKLKTGIFIDMS